MHRRFMAVSLLAAGAITFGYVATQGTHATSALAAAKKTAKTSKLTSRQATAQTTATPTAGHAARNTNPHADGTVTAVNGDAITVQPDADTNETNEYTKVTTIVLNSSTRYAAGRGQTTTTRPTITTSQRIVAEGTVSSDGTTLTATLVMVGSGGHGGHGGHQGGPHADGAIIAVNGDTLTVKADADTNETDEYTKVTTIVLTSTTQYDNGPGSTTSTRPTFAVGQLIVAEGTLSADETTLTATRVSVHTPKA